MCPRSTRLRRRRLRRPLRSGRHPRTFCAHHSPDASVENPRHLGGRRSGHRVRDRSGLLGHFAPGIDRSRPVLGAGLARIVAGADRRRVRSGVESRPAARRTIASAAAGFRRTHRSIRWRRRSDRDLAAGIHADAASSSLPGEGGLGRVVQGPPHRSGNPGGLFLYALARDQQTDAILHRRLARPGRHH